MKSSDINEQIIKAKKDVENWPKWMTAHEKTVERQPVIE